MALVRLKDGGLFAHGAPAERGGEAFVRKAFACLIGEEAARTQGERANP
jgi:hypothetical protein